MRLHTFGRAIALGVLLPAIVFGAASRDPERPPNLIVIVSDDQGFDLAAFGATEFVTPNLDRMAAEGTRATSFYMTASVCTPARSGLITGRYPGRQYKWVSYWPRGNPKNLQPLEELFDLSVDLGEQHNLAEKKPDILAMMRARFARWTAEMEAAEPRSVPELLMGDLVLIKRHVQEAYRA